MKILANKLAKVIKSLPQPTEPGQVLRVDLGSWERVGNTATTPVDAEVPSNSVRRTIVFTSVEFRVEKLYTWLEWELEI